MSDENSQPTYAASADADTGNSRKADQKISEMYEGEEPFLFISYSHRDRNEMNNVKAFLTRKHIRFWYDNGLHSGDDWNLVIAKHLEKATVCLLLLSKSSSCSMYVKNELNFALNHRVPIHTLMLEMFDIPIDIEMMIGRIQSIVMQEGFEEKLFHALPTELIEMSGNPDQAETTREQHPLYETLEKLMERQGTVFFSGRHKALKYPVLVQQDVVREADSEKLMQSAVTACSLSHPLFVNMIDVRITGGYMWSYLGYHKLVSLDDYLKDNRVDEKTIENWISIVIDGMDYLLKKGYAINDFARGSLVVTDDKDLRLIRLHDGYYGIFRLRADNRQYYIENEIREIAALFYQLCTGESPVLPFPMISKSHVSDAFLKKANLIIQKATKEQNRISYTSFDQMKEDLSSAHIRLKDLHFLGQRAKKLEQYMKAKDENLQRFTADDESGTFASEPLKTISLEEEYGFEATFFEAEAAPEEGDGIRLLICSTGLVRSFSKNSIVIGRGQDCDLCFTQIRLSRHHARVERKEDGTYLLTDLNSTNGTGYGNDKLEAGQSVTISVGDVFRVDNIELKLLA